jgi:hypothetical protein
MNSFHKIWENITTKHKPETSYLIYSANGDDNMAIVRTYEVGITLASLQPGLRNKCAFRTSEI